MSEYYEKKEYDEVLDNDWKAYYFRKASLERDLKILMKRSQDAIAAGITLTQVSIIKPTMINDRTAMTLQYVKHDWQIPMIPVPDAVDYEVMEWHLRDKAIPITDWQKVKKGYPKAPQKRKDLS